MRPNQVKRKLCQGGVALGTMVFEFATSGIARLTQTAGAEFVIFDMEHTGWSVETIRTLMATARATEVIPLVRIPATEYHFIARVLDVGAMGLMVPMVQDEAQALKLVQSARYAPQGRRGTAFGVAHDDYQVGDILETMRSANEEQLLIAQIETREGIENVEAIAAVPGIDVLWIGHFDLSTSLGIPGQFDHPEFRQAVKRVLQASHRFGKAAGFLASDVETGKSMLNEGFRMLGYGADQKLYQDTLGQALASLRSAIQ